ncbi:MAG: hypothetical protein ACRCSS_19475 [Shewanella sp.]
MLDKITNILSSGLFSGVKELVTQYFPPDASPQQKAELDLAIRRLELEKAAQLDKAINDSERAITERIATLEGSAQDLRAVPFVGPLVLFLRGLQRPLWSYGCMWVNVMWFSGQWKFTDQQESTMWFMNILVLGFLFGERAIQNVAPLIADLMKKGKQNGNN